MGWARGRSGRAAGWVVAVLLVATGWAVLVLSGGEGIHRSTALAGRTPVRVLEPIGARAGPAVVLAHGFSGSAAMVDPLGSALARAGHLVVLPDLPGHGRNPAVLAEGALEPAVADAVALAAQRSGGPVAVVGHSMGAGAVTSWAVEGRPLATIAVSLPSADELPDDPARPPNLLLLWGSAEQPRFAQAALAGLRRADPASPATTVGSFAQGTARRAEEVPGAEHVSILYRARTAQDVNDWLAAAAGTSPSGTPAGDARLVGVVLVLLGGMVAVRQLLRPPSTSLGPGPAQVVDAAAHRAGLAPTVAGLALAAVVAGLGAAAIPVAAIPVAVAGYLLAWFAVGAVVLLALAQRRRAPAGTPAGLARGLAAGAVLAACLALPARTTWAAFEVLGARWVVLGTVLLVLGSWFWAESRIVAGLVGGRRGAALATSRAVVVVALLAAVVLLGAPGFLTLTVPLMVPILAVLAVVSGWARDPAAAATAQALPLALTVATTFPLVA